jgi:amino acid transporter
MTEYSSELEKIKSDLSKLKIFLILLTVFTFIFFFGFYMEYTHWVEQNLGSIQLLLIFGILHYSGIAIFIWFIWTKYPVENKKKKSDTIMIIFLGIIGLWLWMPNEKELKKLAK